METYEGHSVHSLAPRPDHIKSVCSSQGYLLFPNLTGDRSYPALSVSSSCPVVLNRGNEWLRWLHFLDSLLVLHICQGLLEKELKGIQRQRPVCVCPAILSFFHWASQLHSVCAPRWEVDPIWKELNVGVWLIAVSVPRNPGRQYVSLIWKKGLWIPPACSVFSTSSYSTLLFSSHLPHMSEEQRDNYFIKRQWNEWLGSWTL